MHIERINGKDYIEEQVNKPTNKDHCLILAGLLMNDENEYAFDWNPHLRIIANVVWDKQIVRGVTNGNN